MSHEFQQVVIGTPIASEPNTVPGQMAILWRVHDALSVAFVSGCACGGKCNEDYTKHAENCSARYFGPLREQLALYLSEHGGEQGAARVSKNPSPSPAAEELLKDRERLDWLLGMIAASSTQTAVELFGPDAVNQPAFGRSAIDTARKTK